MAPRDRDDEEQQQQEEQEEQEPRHTGMFGDMEDDLFGEW